MFAAALFVRWLVLPFIGLAFIMLLFTGGDPVQAGRTVSNAYDTAGTAVGLAKGGFPEGIRGFQEGSLAAQRGAQLERQEDQRDRQRDARQNRRGGGRA